MSPQYLQAAVLIGLGILLVLLAIWIFLRANRKTTITGSEGQGQDVLDEGAAAAKRNQALIDAPGAMDAAPKVPASPKPAPAPTAEPIAPPSPAPAPAPAPAPTPTPPPAPAPVTATEADDLRKIKGVGPKLVTLLAEQGITTFAQVAAWTDADVERVDATLGRFAGRITRDQWVEQAKLLSAGEETAFSEKFGQK